MARNSYTTSTSQVLTFHHGTADASRAEVQPADWNGDVYVVFNEGEGTGYLKRDQARRFARALLEAAEA